MKEKYKKNRHSEYFEAIIQLRPLDKRVYDWVKVDIENRNIGVSKELVTKNGFDIYVDSNQYAIALGKKLKKRFDGKVIVSSALHSTHRLTSKQLFRVTMLFRLNEKRIEE